MKRTGCLSRIVEVVGTMALFAAVVFAITWLGTHLEDEYIGYPRVTDGDTLRIGEEKIRLTGIDAPELQQTCKINNQAIECGYKAKIQLEKLIDNQTITCRALRRDRYYRLLGECHLGELNLNRKMVQIGWALSWGDKYRDEEAIAKQENLGIWKSEFIRPGEWRKENESDLLKPEQPWWQIW